MTCWFLVFPVLLQSIKTTSSTKSRRITIGAVGRLFFPMGYWRLQITHITVEKWPACKRPKNTIKKKQNVSWNSIDGSYCLQLAGWLTCKCWYVDRGVSFALFPTFTVGVIKASLFPLISMTFVLDTFWSFWSNSSWFPRSTSRPLLPRSTSRPLFPRSTSRYLFPRSTNRSLFPRSTSLSLFPRGARWSNSSLSGVLHMLSWKRNTLMSKPRSRCRQMNYIPVLGPHCCLRILKH